MSRALEVNWSYWLKRRNENIDSDISISSYLLAPEMNRLIRDRTSLQHEFLLSTLWYTGAKISEVLALDKRSFTIGGQGIVVAFDQGREPREVFVCSQRYQSLVERALKEVKTVSSARANSKKEVTIQRSQAA